MTSWVHHLAAWLSHPRPPQNGEDRAKEHTSGEWALTIRYMGSGMPPCRSHRLHCCPRQARSMHACSKLVGLCVAGA